MDQSNTPVPVPPNLSFESLKKLNQHAVEYWSARDLQVCLGYSNWRDFKNAIKKAIQSCGQSGNSPNHHFADARKPILGGKGSFQIVEDYDLSRAACYLIAQNGDPRKPEIAQAQQYFTIQTRRQEISDQMTADMQRLETHEQVGKEVRAAISRIDGTLPEHILPAEPIKRVEKRIKTIKPRLLLDPKDSLGIINPSGIIDK